MENPFSTVRGNAPLVRLLDLVLNAPMRFRRARCRMFGHKGRPNTFYIVEGVKNRYCWRCGEPFEG